MQQLDVLRKLREAGAVIENSAGVWVATLYDGNELYVPREDGSNEKKEQPKWSGSIEQLRMLEDLPIHTVHIMRKTLTDAELTAITELKATKKLVLHLGHADVSSDSLKGIGRMANLVELFVQSPSVNEEFLDKISTLGKLESLGFSNCSLTADGVRKLHRLPMLVSLNIGWTQLDEDTLAAIAEFENLRQLKLNKIELSGISALDLRGLTSLDSLSLTHATISDEWVHEIGQLRRLTLINFYGTELTDGQFELLFPALIKKNDAGNRLVTLYLDRTRISDETVDLIRATESMRYANAFVVLPATVTEDAAKSLFETNPAWQIVHYQMIGGKPVASQIK